MIALLCLPALARASEPTWLVGTSTGASAARAVAGERIAPGIRVVRCGASAARRLKRLPGVRFVERNRSSVAADLDEAKVYLASSAFNLQWTAERNPEIKFVDIKTTTV